MTTRLVLIGFIMGTAFGLLIGYQDARMRCAPSQDVKLNSLEQAL